MLPILPDAPSRTDPVNFSAKADAWVAALPAWTEAANLLEQSLQLVSTTGTSTTSKTIANGSWTLTTQAGKAWVVGCYLYFASSSDPTKVMTGQVTSYNSTTGSLTANITVVRGSGTYADWVIGLAVPDQAALNLSGGSGGSIPYQSSANTTAMLSAGTAGQVLQSNGAGAPSWVNIVIPPTSGRLLKVTQYTSGSGTHVLNSLTNSVMVYCVGGGGGGGGIPSLTSGQVSISDSPGCGGRVTGYFSGTYVNGAQVGYTVGSGGTGAAATAGSVGTAGSASTVTLWNPLGPPMLSALLQANGGLNGATWAASSSFPYAQNNDKTPAGIGSNPGQLDLIILPSPPHSPSNISYATSNTFLMMGKPSGMSGSLKDSLLTTSSGVSSFESEYGSSGGRVAGTAVGGPVTGIPGRDGQGGLIIIYEYS